MPSREISLVFHSPEGGQIGGKAIRQTLEDDRVPDQAARIDFRNLCRSGRRSRWRVCAMRCPRR